MSYFRELPNFEYQSPFANSTGASDYVTAKNVFRRMKLRDDLKNVFTLFNKRFIEEGERPDTVAEKEYSEYLNKICKQENLLMVEIPQGSFFVHPMYFNLIIRQVEEIITSYINSNQWHF